MFIKVSYCRYSVQIININEFLYNFLKIPVSLIHIHISTHSPTQTHTYTYFMFFYTDFWFSLSLSLSLSLNKATFKWWNFTKNTIFVRHMKHPLFRSTNKLFRKLLTLICKVWWEMATTPIIPAEVANKIVKKPQTFLLFPPTSFFYSRTWLHLYHF